MACLLNANGSVRELAFGQRHRSGIAWKKKKKKKRTRVKRLERQEVRVTMYVNMGDKERGETEIEGDTRREMDVLGDIV